MRNIEQRHVLLGDPEIGQGKTTFAQIVLHELEQMDPKHGLVVSRMTPADLDLVSRSVWGGMEQIYQSPHLQQLAGGHRATGKMSLVDRVVLRLANRDLLRKLDNFDGVFATVHGYMGKDLREEPQLERVFIEGDVRLEPFALDPQTRLLVPTSQTQDQAYAIAKEQGFAPEIDIIGYLVPQQLLDTKRPDELIAFYERGEPTMEDPLRISYLMTGQVAHMKELEKYVFHDSTIGKMIRKGLVKIDVYTAKNNLKAQIAADLAEEAGFSSEVNKIYNPKSDKQVQVVWSPDTVSAVENTFEMAKHGHLLVSPAAERMPWAGTMPFVPLKPVAGNQKMIENTEYLVSNDLTGPASGIIDLGATVTELFAHNGRAARKHIRKGQEVFADQLSGGRNAAAHITELFNSRIAA